MNELEKIQRYIDRTPIPEILADRYDIRMDEWEALIRSNRPCDAIGLAFSYGQAKGYRAAKAEARRG